jgi:uncharacterized repeat protein (TIGR03803 family)
MKRFGFATIACIVTLCCIATTVASHAQTFTSLVHFAGTNGADPVAPLIQGPDGNFYGTTYSGAASNGTCSQICGTLFRMTPEGKVTTLYTFCSQTDCNDGAAPTKILLGPDGNIYGVTTLGGANCHNLAVIGCGTIFKFTPSGTLTTLYSFCVQTNCTDGWGPNSLVLGTDGNFYGTTFYGGTGGDEGAGTFFKITPAGALTTLYKFCHENLCLDGGLPQNLMQANGNFYGTTYQGGTNKNSCGVVFKVTPAGKLTVLNNFDYAEGCYYVHSPLILARDGNLYGNNSNGGANRKGSTYQLTPAGQFTFFYSFCALTDCADGEFPDGGLVQATDGNFYGTTGGTRAFPVNDGTVFELTSDGTLTTLYSFNSVPKAADGAGPLAALLQATDGNFYGTTASGGKTCTGLRGCGTVFKVSTGLGPFVAANPGFGKSGSSVMILGNNLTDTTIVTFNGAPATFTVSSDNFIKATVPTRATTGTIEVTTPSGTLKSNVAFQVLP